VKIKWRGVVFLGVLGILMSVTLPALAEEGYPLRAKFPHVKVISTEALDKEYQKIIIIDVRSKIEFDVIHVNKAVLEPITTALFTKNLEKIRDKSGDRPIAFYCNGHTCAKSYEAAEQAEKAGFQNVFAYDAGINDWVKAHPEKTTLLGKTPAAPHKLISKELFEKRKISFQDFKKRAADADAIVIDAREPFQRKEIPQLPGTIRNIPSDRLVELIRQGEFKTKQLLVMDAVGKQVEWIQYYLEDAGYANYFFLDKGVAGASR
jgi:rhodanese-related sulfurtransferase